MEPCRQVVKGVLPFLVLEEYPFQVLVVGEANLLGALEHQDQEEVVDLLRQVVWEVHLHLEEVGEELMEDLIKVVLEIQPVDFEYLVEEY
jgi:hypothetical protein